ncbi:MAG TPA: Rrf2 family transcriptional regulator, partial [Vicinamibacterales bacterium]|nr:Rrf2 family transcriptional regulator [Vicinamibacterales bacterium]
APRDLGERREKLPHAYLEQLIRDLRRAGLVTARRGQSGGYALSRDASQISMADVMRALEGPILQMPCAGEANAEACDRPQPCSVHEVFQRVYESVSGTLSATMLADAMTTGGGPPYPMQTRRRIRSNANSAGYAQRSS